MKTATLRVYHVYGTRHDGVQVVYRGNVLRDIMEPESSDGTLRGAIADARKWAKGYGFDSYKVADERGTMFGPNMTQPKARALNPLSRVKVGSPSMATGSAPSKRLRKRRAKTEALPPGYYANPLTRVKVRSPSQRPSLPVVAEHGDPSPRLVKRRERTAKLKRPGAYANPSVKTFFDPIAADQMYIIVYAKMRDPWFKGKDKPQWREIARFDDLNRAREYGQAYADANQVQVKIGGNFRIK